MLRLRCQQDLARPAPASLLLPARHQSSDQFHRYLHHPHIVQPDGLDNLVRTKAEQQQWLNTEQWDGYSDTYLKRFMQYSATQEHPNPQISIRNDMLYKCLGLVFELYGTLADDLHELHDNPLHPQFHVRLERIRRDRERIAAELDKVYAGLHPTMKTIYDAMLVRRYYHLEDWIRYVEKKRARIFEDLTPAYLAQARQAQALSEQFLRRLKQLESTLYENPVLGLMSNDQLEQYSAGELAMLQQKATYFRKMKRFGANQLDSDVHTH
ncbi:hypothetical protein STCU_00218 [Strigomonas culicis]|uniref:Uncharacterized protein n=2 Tax=Strigomonas culicis TaxID=28005 RepID=S9V7R3_9TRYP|nr:hypothetical protein STCU_02669 [Strigomonas culicis]EPY36757.1 hypothetical protein STCU_00422 [Strigomonas culicis]EPY37079.1 hypothetical protein STCU_00218 [Strigomonas culicis]|eukprot:EPY32768.1 hypothetical protein STCU_02669 [Strigomonas culicis]